MKVLLRSDTVDALEGLAGKKISRNGDAVIQEVCEMAINAETNDGIEMSVCNNTKKEIDENA